MNLQVRTQGIFQRCECVLVCQLLYCATVIFKVLNYKIEIFFLFFMYCVKSFVNLLQ